MDFFTAASFMTRCPSSCSTIRLVSEECDVVRRRLDVKNEAVVVVHLDRRWSEIVTHACSLDAHAVMADREVAASLAIGRFVRRAAEEGRHIGHFDREDGRPEQLVVRE
jgi:hypothetical protein